MALALFLILGLAGSAAQAASRPSGKCKPLGKTVTVGGNKYTCIKKTGKSVWNSGVPLPSPQKPTPSTTPTVPQVEIEPWIKVFQIVRSYRVSSVSSQTSLDFQATPTFPGTTAANIRFGVLTALNFWSQFEILNGSLPVSLYTEDDYDWYMARWIALGRDNTGPNLWERSRGGGAVGWNSEG